MRSLAKFQSNEHSYAQNDNAVVFAPVLNGSGKKDPRLGCAGIVRRGDDVLLGQRNKEPNRGLWVLPGGGVDFGETLVQTLKRELAEEAGIEVEVDDIFEISELISPPDEHRVIVYMNARYRAGNPVASRDLSDVRFFCVEELKQMSAGKMISPFVESVLRKAALI
jgi:8-oxo-dGTP diphosphatase